MGYYHTAAISHHPNINDARASTLSPDGSLLATSKPRRYLLVAIGTLPADEPKVIHGKFTGIEKFINILT